MKQIQKHQNKGFTLTEILVATAITVILAAIAIPLVVRLSRQIKMTEADAMAREIFITAQNRLSAARASGDLEDFNAQVQSDYSGRALTVKPGDCTDDAAWQGLYYLTGDDAVTQTYLFSDDDVISKTLKGGFLVELDPASGNVYSVFYRAGALSELETLYLDTSDFSLYQYRARADRSTTLTGYYAGADASAEPALTSFAPQVAVVNKEELYLDITCNGLKSILTTQQDLTLTVTLTDAHGGSWTKNYTAASLGADWSFTYDQLSAQIRLDSMSTGRTFADVTGGKLTPGDNITAEVSMLYENGSRVISTPSPVKTASFSSLFAFRSDKGVVQIGYLRQLNNLRASLLSADSTAGITAVQQTRTIDFSAEAWEENAVCPSARVDKKPVNPLQSFTPLENGTLFGINSLTAGQASFTGGELRNFVIAGSPAIGTDNPGTGLFSRANCTISSVRLVDPAVTGGSNTGALVGSLLGGRVENCGVYLATVTDDGVFLDQTAVDASMAAHTVTAAAGSQRVGGLVGQALGQSELSNSFAAVNVQGTDTGACAGGLVGWFSGRTAANCYASGGVTAGSYAGGLAGRVLTGSVTECYSTSNVTAGSIGGGFTARLEADAQITESAAYGLTARSAGTDLTGLGAFLPSEQLDGTVSGCVYLRQNGYNDHFTAVAGVTAEGYAALQKAAVDAGLTISSDQSYPYATKLLGTAFPFARTGTQSAFYGPWPEEYTIDTSLVYYEVYTDAGGSTSLGYYAEGYTAAASQAWTLNTLKSQTELTAAGLVLKEDGYAVLSVYNLSRMVYSLNDETQQTLTKADTAQSGAFTLLSTERRLSFTDKNSGAAFDVEYVYLYQLPLELQETSRDKTAAFYDTLNLSCYAKGAGGAGVLVTDQYTFYYCPHFAKNAINPDVHNPLPGRPKDPSVIYVRSARQLNALGRFYYYWNTTNNGAGNKFDFRQEINISFSDYTAQYCGAVFNLMDTSQTNTYRNRPIGESASTSSYNVRPSQFRNTYDGGGYEIKNYCLQCYGADKIRFAGLFGEALSATLRNIHMVSDGSAYVRSTFADADNSAVGGLLGLSYVEGTSSNTVQNCSISGYTIQYTGSSAKGNIAAGGLMGINMGTLTGCSAVSKLVTVQMADGGSKTISVGGLVGSNNTTTLSGCYAGGLLSMQVTKNGVNSLGGIAGGYCYTYSGNSGKTGTSAIANCSSVCAFSTAAPTGYASYTSYGVAGAGPAVPNRTYTLTNCYYLSNTVTGTPSAWTNAAARSYTALTQQTIAGFAAAQKSYPSTASLTGSYPFPTSVVRSTADTTPVYVHYGDWPAYTPAAPAGKLGIVSRSRTWYYFTWSYSTGAQFVYDAGSGQTSASGAPAVLWADNDLDTETRYYLFVSADLVPSYAAGGTDAWTVTSSNSTKIQVSSTADSGASPSGYTYYQLNVSAAGTANSTLTFSCRGMVKLKLNVKISSSGTMTVTQVT